MNLAQSPHIPAEGAKPRFSDFGWLARYAIRGLWELIRARLIFASLKARDIPERNRRSKEMLAPSPTLPPATIPRISYILPRLSDRLPWRSDCLIQAVAGQNWLSSLGVPSEIRIGVEKPSDGEFGAHAWLIQGGQVVTGGDISRYIPLLAEEGGNG